MAPHVHRRRTMTRKTLVILDEIHHAGDSRSWGDGVKAAFEPAVRRLMLTGTPFRSDDNPIPFVHYERGADGLARSRSDTTYGYADALADGVVRPGHLPRVLRRDPLADLGRRRAGRPPGRADDPGPDRAGLAHRPRPDRRLDAAGPARRRRPAAGAARRRHARRRRPGHRQRPDGGPGVREAPRRHHRREGRRGPLRRSWAPPAGSPRSPRRTSAGWSPSGWCPRASTSRAWPSACTPPAPPRRCSSPRRSAGSCGPAARRDRDRLRAQRAAPAGAGQRDGGPAQPRPRRAEDEGRASTTTSWSAPSARRRPATSWRSGSRRCPRPPSSTRSSSTAPRSALPAQTGTPEEEEYLGLPGLLTADQVLRAADQAPGRAGRGRAAPAPAAGRRDRLAAGAAEDRGGAPHRPAPPAQHAGRSPPPPHRTCHTARSTPSCAGCAVARRAPRRRSSSSRSGSPPSRPCDHAAS